MPMLLPSVPTLYQIDYFCEVMCDSSVTFQVSFGLLSYVTSVEVTVPFYSTCTVSLTAFHGITLGNMLTGSASTLIPSKSMVFVNIPVQYHMAKLKKSQLDDFNFFSLELYMHTKSSQSYAMNCIVFLTVSASLLVDTHLIYTVYRI